jgi:hypothetical protein
MAVARARLVGARKLSQFDQNVGKANFLNFNPLKLKLLSDDR